MDGENQLRIVFTLFAHYTGYIVTMDSTKLPQPTPPQSAEPNNGTNDSNRNETPASSTSQVPPSSDAVTAATAAGASPSLAAAPSPSISQQPPTPAATSNAPTPTPASVPTSQSQASNQATPTFKSPIIEGLKSMDSQPFNSSPVDSPNSQQAANKQTGSASAVPREQTQTQLGEPLAPAAGSVPPTPPSNSQQPSANKQIPHAQNTPAWKKLLGNKKIIFSLMGVLLLVVGIVFAWKWWSGRQLNLNNPEGTTPTVQTKLVYWGLWEDQELVQPLIDQYEQENPNITIEYELQNKRQYRDRLQAAIKQGRGPDIFRFHNTWVPMLDNQLAKAPRSVISAEELEKDFYPVAARDLTKGSQVIGVPLMYDGIALVYNTSMLAAANAQPPSDWRQVRELASRLAVSNEGRLERGGIALGTADNVDHFSDTLALLMMQNGASPGNPSTANAQTALEFYTIFNRLDRVWDTTMAQSTLAFANEQVAMIIVPSWRLHEIERLNPNLQFGVSELPQLSDERLTWATYWVEGVSAQSANQQAAWEFVAWLSQPEQLRKLYDQATKYRSFGELYPRVSMASELSDDPKLAPYLEDALYARSWYMADATHDEGLNDKLKAHYLDAVNAMNNRGDAERSLEQVAPGVQQVLSMYGVAVRAVAPTTN